MAISYAGVTLATPLTEEVTGAIKDRVKLNDMSQERSLYQPTLFSQYFHFPPGWDPPEVELGTLFWPTGATRYGIGYYLATDNEVTAIKAVVGSAWNNPEDLVLTWIDAGNGGVMVDSVTADMFMLAPQPLFSVSGLPAPLRKLNLITLVDQRWLFQTVSTGILGVTDQSTTWTQLYDDLAIALGITPTGAAVGDNLIIDPINSAYQNVPGQLGVSYESAALWMDGTAYSVGQRFVSNTNSQCRVMSSANSKLLVNANTALPTARTVLSGGPRTASDVLVSLPNTIQIVVPLNTEVFAFSAPFSPTGHNQLWMRHHSINFTGSNTTIVQNLVNQLAKDLLTWNTQLFDCTWNGIVSFTPEGLHDIEWTHRYGRVSTRLTPSPYNDFFVPIVLRDVKCIDDVLTATYSNGM